MKQVKTISTIAVYLFFSFTMICTSQHSKWIVITTINQPTQAVKKFATLDDWQVLIIGDKKTPKEWHLSNCIFLSVEQQEQLDFQIIKLLPYNHYSRKNIGYLYAIQHGAEIIYDTDDDNILKSHQLLFYPSQVDMLSYDATHKIINIYKDFGQPTVWPRGFPLEAINDKHTAQLSMIPCRPLIQQGLVDGDPDVDAVFRLTRGELLNFDHHANPICLPAGTMCPFNSQNTIFHYEALWGLLLPITPSFRVCDIWRGYSIQRILWELNANLCFTPPCIIQDRNAHSLLHDFADEIDLYLKAGKLVEFLSSWKREKPTLYESLIDLVDNMVQEGFYKEKDSQLIRAWIQDLKKIGYLEPKLKK